MNELEAKDRAKELSLQCEIPFVAMKFPESNCCGITPEGQFRSFYAAYGFTVLACYKNGEKKEWTVS